jgi:hypothetical protein
MSTPKESVSSLGGNAASYQSGGKKRKAGKTAKRPKKSRKSRGTKKCWWKMW